MPPWVRPKNAAARYSPCRLLTGMNTASATICRKEPSISVLSPPIRSEIQPEVSRLMIPQVSISDSICAPSTAVNPRSPA